MTGDTDRASIRLAELVAALSLGVDLGFGQPMEHVPRQCLIALRLAERIGLDEEQRADVASRPTPEPSTQPSRREHRHAHPAQHRQRPHLGHRAVTTRQNTRHIARLRQLSAMTPER
jgi:hypothetical protein